MNTKSIFLSLFTTLSIGLMHADETSVEAMRLVKDNVQQLLTLQDNNSNSDMVKTLMAELALNARLQMHLRAEYNKCDCDLAGSCDQLPSALAAYKESIIKLIRLEKEGLEAKEYKQVTELLAKL